MTASISTSSVSRSFSVGVPVFNQAEFLTRTLDSLLSQTIPPLEIVVSDNHSTDGTRNVLRRYEHSVEVMRPPQHLSMMSHWNFLVSRLKGSHFALLSSDDVAKPNYVEVLSEGFRAADDSVLVRAGFRTVDQRGELIAEKYILTADHVTRPPRTLREQLGGPKVSFAAFAVRRDAWEDVGGFPEECSLYGDWGLWLKLAAKGSFIYEPEIISEYRVYSQPDVKKSRFFLESEDEVHIYTRLMPAVARRLEGVEPSEIKRASRFRLLQRLDRAGKILEAEERTRLYDIVIPWARLVDETETLRRFREGNDIRVPKRFKLANWAKNSRVLRRVYAWLRYGT